MDEERMEKTEVVPGSTGAYIGFEILFALPGVGLICAIIFGFFIMALIGNSGR